MPRIFRPEAVHNYVSERRGAIAGEGRVSRSHLSLLWLALALLLAGLVGLGRAPVPVTVSGSAFAAPGQARLVALLPEGAARARVGDRLTWRPAAGGPGRNGKVSAIDGASLEGAALQEVLSRRGLSLPPVSEPASVIEVALEGGAAPGGALPGSCSAAAGTVRVELGSRPLFSLIPGLEWVQGEEP